MPGASDVVGKARWVAVRARVVRNEGPDVEPRRSERCYQVHSVVPRARGVASGGCGLSERVRGLPKDARWLSPEGQRVSVGSRRVFVQRRCVSECGDSMARQAWRVSPPATGVIARESMRTPGGCGLLL